jgi:hypothetical protein
VNNFRESVNNINQFMAGFSTFFLKRRQILPIKRVDAARGRNHWNKKNSARKKSRYSHLNQAGMNGLPMYRQLTGMICLMLAEFFCVHAQAASRAYLPATGVPPLRFQIVTSNYFVFDPKLFPPQPKPSEIDSNAVNTLAASTNPTHSTAISQPVASSPANAGPLLVGAETSPDERKDAVSHFKFDFSSAAASDLLTVTPQMITQYLKPDSAETNRLDRPGAVVFVPAEMQFTPPNTKITAESCGTMGNESRATYQTQ